MLNKIPEKKRYIIFLTVTSLMILAGIIMSCVKKDATPALFLCGLAGLPTVIKNKYTRNFFRSIINVPEAFLKKAASKSKSDMAKAKDLDEGILAGIVPIIIAGFFIAIFVWLFFIAAIIILIIGSVMALINIFRFAKKILELNKQKLLQNLNGGIDTTVEK